MIRKILSVDAVPARHLVVVVASVCLFGTSAAGQSILTVAGGGSDDGRPATAAGLSEPSSVVVDASGNLLIADKGNGRIRKIWARTGIITTVAGNGSVGYSGDGGPATAAGLNGPSGIALDVNGDLYFAEPDSCRIRKVDGLTGIITTVAGIGNAGYSGDGGPATVAKLSSPRGVALDRAGNLLIADSRNMRVRMVAAGSGIITTVAGNGSMGYTGDGGPATAAGLSDPYSIAVDGEGNLFLADRSVSCTIRKVNADTGIISSVAGNGHCDADWGDGGPATAAGLPYPSAVAVDWHGNVFISLPFNHRVRRVAAGTGIITAVAGIGSPGYSGDGTPASTASLSSPIGVSLGSSGDLFIADSGNNRIREVAAGSGTIRTVAGTGTRGFSEDGVLAVASALGFPQGLAVDRSGDLYIADWGNYRVRKVAADNGVITTVAGKGTYGFTGDGGPATEAALVPGALAVASTGDLYIADAWQYRVRKVSALTGSITTVAGNGSIDYSGDGGLATAAGMRPLDLTLDPVGNLLIADCINNRVRAVAAGTGIITTTAGTGSGGYSGDGGPATAASLDFPSGLALDEVGTLFVADAQNSRIRAVAPRTGIIATAAGTSASGFGGDGGPATGAVLNFPLGVTVDSRGDLLIVDTFNHRVRTVAAGSGTIRTIAGNGSPMYSGDGGPATMAGLNAPVRVAVDRTGNVYIADQSNNRVRLVSACNAVSVPSVTVLEEGGAFGLSWGPVVAAFRYDLYLDVVNPPVRLEASGLTYTTPTPFIVPAGASQTHTLSNLNPGTTYFHRVVAKGDPYCPTASTASSEVGFFTTVGACSAPSPSTLVSPGSGASGVAAATQLTWQAASGAANYDVYLGTTSPPRLIASGVTATSYMASALSPGGTYYWNIVAHAACDPAKTTSTPTQTFTVAGACAAAGAFSQTSPAAGASGIPVSTTLSWSPSSNASAYDVFLGTSSTPPLYAPGVSATMTSLAVTGLNPGGTYYWKVVARVTCGTGLDRSTDVVSFGVAGSCVAPQATTPTFIPTGGVGVGQTYAIAWKDSPGVDAGGGYLVERSTDISFPSSRETQRTTGTSATFVASTAGTYYHRIRPVAGCGAEGNNTFPAPVQAVPGAPNIVFTVQPSAVVTALGDRLEDQKTTFTLENISKSPVTAIVGTGTLSGIPFFTVYDPLGQSTALQILEPRKPKTFEIRFSGPPADKATSYEGIVSVAAAGLPVVPYAFVNLKVGGSSTSAPVFRQAGATTEYASFAGYSTKGDETLRPPLTVDIQNPGSTPMELGAEIGPELWLVPEPGWNATPIPPNSSRTVRFTTRRTWAPNASALPRYTYFTLRTKSGQTARLLVQDNDASALSQARTAPLDRSVRAYLVPSVAHVGAQGGGSFISRVRLSNTGTEDVQTDLIFTPSGSDGFDPTTVKKATVVIPKNDLVNLTDPLVQLFGLEPPAYGTLEVRAAPEKIGFLTITSGVDAPAPTGGSYGFQMPVAIRGEGARLGVSHLIPGITATSSFRTNLILAETTGIDGASVRVTLYDNKGTRIGDQLTSVLRYGQQQISNVVPALGGGSLEAARLELSVESGGGSVVGVVTVIDSSTLDAASYASQPGTTPPTGSFVARAMKKPLWTQGAPQKSTLLVPSIVNGFPSFKGQDLPYTFRSLMGFTSGTLSSATFTLTYKDQQNGTTTVKTVTAGPRQTVEYKNVVEDLFGLPAGAKSQGPVFVEADLNGIVYSKVYSNLDKGSLGDAFPIVRIGPSPGEELLGKVSAKPILIDGLEQSEDESRGTRSNLILTEVLGYPTTVTVSLYEAGNRTTPIAEKEVTIAALDKVQLSTVFGGLELETGKDYVTVPNPRKKDRTNVLCVVTARSGEGMVSAVVTTIDNKTADLRNAVLTPTGGVPASGSGMGVGR